MGVTNVTNHLLTGMILQVIPFITQTNRSFDHCSVSSASATLPTSPSETLWLAVETSQEATLAQQQPNPWRKWRWRCKRGDVFFREFPSQDCFSSHGILRFRHLRIRFFEDSGLDAPPCWSWDCCFFQIFFLLHRSLDKSLFFFWGQVT